MPLQTKLFTAAILAAICWTIVMKLFSPDNIVQFELAGTTSVATEIINAWEPEGVAKAKTSTYLDFIYIIFYSAAIALGCRVAATYSKVQTLGKIAVGFFVLTIIAGLCDVIENIAMLQTLNEVTQATVSLAAYCAAIKFTLLFVAMLFVLVAFAIGAIRNVRS